MAGFSSSGDDDLISGINVTPLVDVVLVLLIIFLITAPALYQSAIKVQLPKAKSGDESPKAPLNFVITRDGKLMLDKNEIPWDSIPARVNALGAQAAEQTVLISADTATPHGTVIRLMDLLRQGGLTRFGLSVEGSGTTH
jgi:biopolymer transport protein ExbD